MTDNKERSCLQERQLDWVLREYGSSATVPTQALLQVLQSELLVRRLSVDVLSSELSFRVAFLLCTMLELERFARYLGSQSLYILGLAACSGLCRT